MKHRLADLLDIPRLQSALDSLCLSSGIPSAILDTEGNILTASGWQDVCTKFHRVHPEARKRCAESDLYINRNHQEANPSISYQCLHGLMETAAPVIIEGDHIGTVHTGQVFREAPDLESFRARAKVYGFDEGTYIDAVKKVPIISGQTSQANLAVIAHLTGMLAEMGLEQTREKEAERRLKESLGDYRTLFDQTSDGIIIMSTDGDLIDVNESFARMHGYSSKEMMRMNIKDLDTLKTEGLVTERMRRVLAGETLTFEVNHYHKDGHAFPVEVSTCLVSYRGKCCIQGSHRDITRRKVAEEELRRNRELLQKYVSHSPIHAFIKEVTPTESRVLHASDNYEQMIGIPGRDMAGKTMTELFPAEFAAKITADDWSVVARGEVLKLEEDLNGRSYISIKFPIVQGDKTLLGGYTIDITDQKRAEEERLSLERQVQQAQKMESLGVLAGGIAHDFNNLLMVVLGHAELALGAISPMSPARNSLTEISTAARRAADLSQQMLAYSGKALFALERVDLRELVGEMAHLLQAAISKKAILILNLNLEQDLPPIEADPSQIRQIVMNLIINASEAIGDRDGVIRVSAGATRCDAEYLQKSDLHDGPTPGLYVYLEVTDTGVGMDAQTRSRIFEPFFSTKFTGRGLGLSAVQGIVRAHKGALNVFSEPGKGTTFKVLLQALEDAGEKARSCNPSPLSGWRGKGTILLVDDEDSLLALGSRMLERLGFTVLTATDGLQAVDRYREKGKEIDLVLMDLTMPQMDGAEAFDEIRRLNPDARVVLASGYTEEDVSSRFEGKKPAGIIQKPYTLARLRESLAGLLPVRSTGA